MTDSLVVIVEGKNDREKLCRLMPSDIVVLCTYGIPSHDKLMEMIKKVGDSQVIIFTDGDDSGRRIRSVLSDVFPDAIHLHTKVGYAGVEGTPDEFLIRQLEKAGIFREVKP